MTMVQAFEVLHLDLLGGTSSVTATCSLALVVRSPIVGAWVDPSTAGTEIVHEPPSRILPSAGRPTRQPHTAQAGRRLSWEVGDLTECKREIVSSYRHRLIVLIPSRYATGVSVVPPCHC